MAKRIVRSILKKYLNRFLLDELTTAQLDSASLGELQLNNLELDPKVKIRILSQKIEF